MKKFAALVMVAIALCASGCTSTSEIMQSWMGNPVSNLIASWGPPQQVYADGNGGRVLVYLIDHTYKVPASSSTMTFANGGVNGNQFYGNAQSFTTYTPEHTAGYTAYRMFWVGADGIIYKWQWKGL